jgi:hypothetical protein
MVVGEVCSGGLVVPRSLERFVVGILGGWVVGLLAVLVTHFLVLLGIFPGAFVVVFCSSPGDRLTEVLVTSSRGSQAS